MYLKVLQASIDYLLEMNPEMDKMAETRALRTD